MKQGHIIFFLVIILISACVQSNQTTSSESIPAVTASPIPSIATEISPTIMFTPVSSELNSERSDVQIEIRPEDIDGRFPEALRAAINRMEELKDSEGKVYARVYKAQIEGYKEPQTVLVQENGKKAKIAPFGTALLGIFNGEPTSSYYKLTLNPDTNIYEWVRIPTNKNATYEEPIAKMVESLHKSEVVNDNGTGFRVYLEGLNYGVEFNPDEKLVNEEFHKFFDSYANSKQLIAPDEMYWEDLGLRSGMTGQEFEEYLKTHEGGPRNRAWWIDKVRFMVGSGNGGHVKQMIEYPGAYMDKIYVLTWGEHDYKENPFAKAYIKQRLVKKGFPFWGSKGEGYRPDIDGFIVPDENTKELLWVYGVLDLGTARQYSPEWFGRQLYGGTPFDAQIASAWWSFTLEVMSKRDLEGKSGLTVQTPVVNTCIASECNHYFNHQESLVNIDEIENPLFIKNQ